jgi:hypothetical protein
MLKLYIIRRTGQTDLRTQKVQLQLGDLYSVKPQTNGIMLVTGLVDHAADFFTKVHRIEPCGPKCEQDCISSAVQKDAFAELSLEVMPNLLIALTGHPKLQELLQTLTVEHQAEALFRVQPGHRRTDLCDALHEREGRAISKVT